MSANQDKELKHEFLHHMRQYRHDILNHIQLLKGYISMGKLEEAQKYIDHMVIQAHDDAKISEMGDSELSYDLLTRKWAKGTVQVDVEYEIHPSAVHLNPHLPTGLELLPFINDILNDLEQVCQPGAENHLLIIFHHWRDKLGMTLEMEGYERDQVGQTEISHLRAKLQEHAVDKVLDTKDGQQFKLCCTFEVV